MPPDEWDRVERRRDMRDDHDALVRAMVLLETQDQAIKTMAENYDKQIGEIKADQKVLNRIYLIATGVWMAIQVWLTYSKPH